MEPSRDGSNRETGEARGTNWNFDVDMDVGVPAPLELRRQEVIPTVPPPALPPEHDSQESKMRVSEVGRPLGCPACETPGPGKSHTRECKTCQDAWEESRRTATAEEVKRGVEVDQDTRPLDPSSTSTDPDPKGLNLATVTDVETPAGQMDQDTSLSTPTTSHPLDPDAEKAHHIRGEDELKFDVNEEDWPNAEVATRSIFEGALIDGLAAEKVKAGDEREITQMKDLQQCSWNREEDAPPGKSIFLTGWVRRMKGTKPDRDVSKRIARQQ